MGPVSTLLRAPVVAVTGGDELQRYRAGALACLLVLAAVAAAVAFLARRRGRPWLIVLLATLAIVAMPATVRVVEWGHPEELLTVALILAAVLLAAAGRARWAGVAIGLAVACKLWALAAVPAVIVMAPAALRTRAALAGLLVAGALYVPMALANPSAFHRTVTALGEIGSAPGTVSRPNIWFRFAREQDFNAPIGFDAAGNVVANRVRGFALPRSVARLAHALILAAGVGLALFWWRRGRPGGLDGALLVIALALLLRCLLDPGSYSYYHAPFLIVLVARDALARRFPWLAIGVAASFELAYRWILEAPSPDAFNARYLMWALPVAALLTVLLVRLRPDGERLEGRAQPVAAAQGAR